MRSWGRCSAQRDRRKPHGGGRHHRQRLGGEGAADGHTLLLAAASHTITGSLYAKLPYHPIDDFTASRTSAAWIRADDQRRGHGANLKEFINYSKSNPGKLNYASAGNGSATHLSMAYLASLTAWTCACAAQIDR